MTVDRERRELVSRETTVKATDKTTVLGTVSLLAGAVQHVATGDYAIAASGKFLARVEGDAEAEIDGQQKTHVKGGIETQTDGALTEKIAQLRKSIAAGGQQIMGPTVHIGSEGVNTLQMMLETIDLLAQLASQCASHSHPGTGGPTTAAAFSQTAAQATQTRSRYESINA
nr:phage tail sheath family protein [Cronobacter dublinensis]